MQKNKAKESFVRLLEVMDELRANCPWDKEQTIASLRVLTIEECFELSDAILKKDYSNIKEELGDLLLHIVFYAKIAEEKELFDIIDVINGLKEKLIYRHPHIYGDINVKDSKEVKKNWEKLKSKRKTVLEGVSANLPTIIKAKIMQDKAAGVGFDWENKEDAWEKVKEEIKEFEVELENQNKEEAEKEFGDILFSLINIARLYKINPDDALEKTNRKFKDRFLKLEVEIKKQNKIIGELNIDELEKIWQEVKKKEKIK